MSTIFHNSQMKNIFENIQIQIIAFHKYDECTHFWPNIVHKYYLLADFLISMRVEKQIRDSKVMLRLIAAKYHKYIIYLGLFVLLV